jgi:hypothetical protein
LWYGEANAASNAISYANFYSRSPASAIQIARPLQSKIDTQPQLEPAFLEIVGDNFPILHRTKTSISFVFTLQ